MHSQTFTMRGVARTLSVRSFAEFLGLASVSVMPVLAQQTAPQGVLPAACVPHLFKGQLPQALSPALQHQSAVICNQGFAGLFNGVAGGPMYAAEYVEEKALQQSSRMTRLPRPPFHAESALAKVGLTSPQDADYIGSRYYRTPLSTPRNRASDRARWEAYSYANVAPMEPSLATDLWVRLEEAIQGMVRNPDGGVRKGPAYVVTGAVYNGAQERIGGSQRGSMVPTAFYKAMYFPVSESAGAYWVPNNTSGTYELISLAELQRRSGFIPFPALNNRTFAEPGPLPLPRARILDRQHVVRK